MKKFAPEAELRSTLLCGKKNEEILRIYKYVIALILSFVWHTFMLVCSSHIRSSIFSAGYVQARVPERIYNLHFTVNRSWQGFVAR